MVLANDVLEFVRLRIQTEYNKGYANEQESRRHLAMLMSKRVEDIS